MTNSPASPAADAPETPGQRPLSELPVRRLRVADLPACLRLAQDRNWRPEEQKWCFLFEVGQVYGLDDPEGGLAATAVLTSYGPTLAVVGMVLVAARYNRQGLGRRIMLQALEAAQGGPVALYATEAGRPLYEQLGFRTLSTTTTHVGHFQAQPAATGAGLTRPATSTDWAAIFRLDALVTSTSRQAVLHELFRFAEHLWVLEQNQEIRGYAAAWRNIEQVTIGPVIAPDAAGAQQLIAALGKVVGEQELIRLDLDTRRPDMLAWARQQGLQPTFTVSLMLQGAENLPGHREQLFAPITLALD